MKPYDCWYCKYVGKCLNTYLHTCNKFEKWRLNTSKEIAKRLGISQKKFFRLCKQYDKHFTELWLKHYNIYLVRELINQRYGYYIVENINDT